MPPPPQRWSVRQSSAHPLRPECSGSWGRRTRSGAPVMRAGRGPPSTRWGGSSRERRRSSTLGPCAVRSSFTPGYRATPWRFCCRRGARRSEERRVGKSVDLGGRRIIKKKKVQVDIYSTELGKLGQIPENDRG